MKTCVQARIFGRVQGVGFRPTVYRYATRFGLAGFVCNTPEGVTLEVEGDEWKIGAFFRELVKHPPTQASITDIRQEIFAEKGYAGFRVVESSPEGNAAAQISPDLATCDDCLAELFDPQDRRHGYPFINCTNCGPRFTLVRDLPYDRDRTSMAGFRMCGPCDHEYHEPRDRRFHAQPNACEDCGPKLRFVDPSEEAMAAVRDSREPASLPESDATALARTADLLRRGFVVAIKGLGGYHLACDAGNRQAVLRLRRRKHRPSKPFAVMFRNVATVKRCCELSEAEEAELLSAARPIVLLKHKPLSLEISKCVSPDSNILGAFLPYTPLHHLLMQEFEALVMTSANLVDEPILSDEAGLPPLLERIADAALAHDRPILHPCDDSVVRIFNGQRQFLRRARGFVPNPIRIAPQSQAILAVGGELKNAFCLVRDGNAYLSQHLGDLKNYRTFELFRREIDAWSKLMRVEPTIIAHDLHPAYLSTRFARKLCGNDMPAAAGNATETNSPPLHHSIPPLLVPVQHHHAHIASVIAEHDLQDTVIGVALDGTGYGPDGTIWGGEILVADRCQFERLAHFKPYRLPGGDKAVEEPWRMAASVLWAEGLWDHAPMREGNTARAWEGAATIQTMIESGFHSPLTSSAGRLFDAVAALLGLCDAVDYEAQGAIHLESIAHPGVTESYPFDIAVGREPWILDFGPTIRALVTEMARGEAPGQMSAKFHNTVAAAVAQACGFVREQRGLRTVALSGGVFQNTLLLHRTVELLRAQRFSIYTNTAVPPNDGGLALGQAVVALARTKDQGNKLNARASQARNGSNNSTALPLEESPCV